MKNNILVFVASLIIFLTINKANSFSKYKLDVIVIDAGHGGKDPGSIGKMSYEKDIALKISLQLGRIINENFPRTNSRRGLRNLISRRPCACSHRNIHGAC